MIPHRLVEQLAWQDDAACRPYDNWLFFPRPTEHPDTVDPVAERLCATCPVKSECLDWALRHENDGYWGGTTPAQRTQLRKLHGIRCTTPTALNLTTDRTDPEEATA